MPITLLDVILIGITLFSAILAMVRGFSREVLSVASWAGAAAAAYFLYPSVVPLVQPYISGEDIAKIAAAGIVFLITLIVLSIITMKIADFIIDSRIGPLDRTLGFLFGAARGVLLVVVGMLFFNWLVAANQPDWIANAKSKPILDSLGKELLAYLPEDPNIIEKLKPSESVPAEGEQAAPEPKPEDGQGATGTNGNG